MSITSPPSTSPVAPAPQAASPTSSAQLQPASTPPTAAPRAPETAANSPQPSSTPAAIGFSLNFDPSTGRMFLEAREPDSGFVIYRMPPKYVVKQFTATIGDVAPARGTQIDGAA